MQIFICKKSKLKKENVKTERRLTFEFLRQESRQRYSLRDSITIGNTMSSQNIFDLETKCDETSGANLNSRKLYSRVLNNFAEHFSLNIWFKFYDLFNVICKYLIRKAISNFWILRNIYFDFFSTYITETVKQGRDSCLKINKYYVIFQNSTISHIPNSFSDEKPGT